MKRFVVSYNNKDKQTITIAFCLRIIFIGYPQYWRIMILNHETENGLSLGIDVGSTTAKLVVLRNGEIIHRKYERHFSEIRKKVLEMLNEAAPLIGTAHFTAAISGSAGLGIANGAGIPFVQEVYATGEVIKRIEPDTSAIIELGGEDAKIIFFEGGTDERMNGTCAGGTGAFIDQMATLLDMTPDEMDTLSLTHQKIYPIASRCGVFAKTDVKYLSGRCQPDHCRSCTGTEDHGKGYVPRRSPLFLQGTSPTLQGNTRA